MKYRSILGILAGSGAAQAVTILSYPLLARLYTPADYGIYGGVMGIVAVATTMMRMRADKLVLFTEVDSVRRDLLLVFLLLNAAGAALWIAAIPLLRNLLPAAGADLLVIGVIVAIASSILYTLTGVHTSALKTRRIVHSQFLRNVAVAVAQAGLFFLALGPFGLMIGTAVGVLLAIWFLLRAASSEGLLPSFKGLDAGIVGHAWKAHAPRLFWGSMQGLAGSITNAAPLVFAASAFSPGMAGLYVMADRIVRLPVSLLVTTIRSYVAVHSRNSDGEPDIRFMLTIALAMGGIALLVIAPLMAVGEILFTFFLGDDWVGTGSVAGILSIYILFSFVALPAQAFVQSLGRSRELIYIELLYLAARLLPMFYWGTALGLHGLAIVVVLSNLLYNGSYGLYFIVAYKTGRLEKPALMARSEPT